RDQDLTLLEPGPLQPPHDPRTTFDDTRRGRAAGQRTLRDVGPRRRSDHLTLAADHARRAQLRVAGELPPPPVEHGAAPSSGPQDALDLLQREPEDLLRGLEDVRPYQLRRCTEDRPFREVEHLDEVVLGVLTQADPGAVDGDQPPHDPRL